jgi:general secretion pathway protein A
LYNGFFKLEQDPFRLTPDPRFFYVTTHHREALAGLVHSVRNRAGLAVLTGDAGTGKTTLLQVLRNWMDSRQFVAAVFTNPALSRAEFYDFLLVQMGVECGSSLKSRQIMAFEQALLRYRTEGRRPVLIVDEAHRLSTELLDEVRLLLNLETPEEKLLDIIMAGQSELMDVLRRPEMRHFKQRVSCFCRLRCLTRDETREYIDHRQARAGYTGPRLFPEPTVDVIHEYTGGIPRLVNSLCDSALRVAFAGSSSEVTPSVVHEAAVDLDLVDTDTPAIPSGSVVSEDYAGRQQSLEFLTRLTDAQDRT